MARLIAKSATLGQLPLTIGALTLTEDSPARLTAIAPWQGKDKGAETALRDMGLAWPAPDRAVAGGEGAAILWSGRGQAFLLNADPEPLAALAALTDVADGWVALTLTGPDAAEALARLIPLDLSPRAFPPGATARTGLGHMMCLLWRTSDQGFRVFVFRSMVTTAVHEIGTAMRSLAARAEA